MAEKLDYECLPQRAPRQKRKLLLDTKPSELLAEGTGAAVHAQFVEAGTGAAEPSAAELVATTVARDPPGNGTANVQEGETNAGDLATTAPEQLAYRAAAETGQKFEYLDHTADVQLHAWGANLQEAFENVALSMFNYMTPLEGITDEGPSAETHTYKAEAHDLPSLLYHWLDELLFDFSNEFFVPKTMKITSFDREAWKIEAEGTGERFDRGRHVSGTEIKAITYSAMQINETEGDAEIFVIVDI